MKNSGRSPLAFEYSSDFALRRASSLIAWLADSPWSVASAATDSAENPPRNIDSRRNIVRSASDSSS